MKSERKNIFGSLFSIMIMMVSLVANFAIVAPAVLAANGEGEVTYLSIDGFVSPIDDGVISVNENKDIVFKIHNDADTQDVDPNDCIDEIIITFPSTWQGSINTGLVTVTNMNDVLITNEKDGGDYTSLTGDGNSIRIIPNDQTNGVMLCPSGTTQITIPAAAGLSAPANPEDSEIQIMTSDQDHNEPSTSHVRELLPYLGGALPLIHVTSAIEVEIQYMDLENFVAGAGGADYKFTGIAKGGWARLDKIILYVNSFSPNPSVFNIYMDKNGDGVLQTGSDYKIASNKKIEHVGYRGKTLDDYAGVDIVDLVEEGFLIDRMQAVSAEVDFFIDFTTGSADLELAGHSDRDADGSIDPTYTGTGYFNLPKEGTVINVENSMKRNIHAQLIREMSNNRIIYVQESGIPIYYTTTLSSFEFPSPRDTDADGEVEIFLLPGTVAGNALVTLTFPDVATTQEDVAIAPGVAASFTVSAASTVVAGDVTDIVATIYDQYGNKISNNPDRPIVSFEVLSSPGDADLDDDTNPPFSGDGDGWESEPSTYGVGDATLKTSDTIGDNVVEVCVAGLGCQTVTVTGVIDQADAIDCIIDPEDYEITADECFDILVHVVDKNGNPLSKWESIVDISLDQLDSSPSGTKYIQSTDLREEQISSDGQSVQGKLNPNAPAYATVTVCGCEALGQLDVVCESDTLTGDRETIDVINSDADCIDVNPIGFDDCDSEGELQVSIVDTCGNPLVDQECGTAGWAESCVALAVDSCGVLSTDKTCVDLSNTGLAPLVDLDISDCPCGDVSVTVTDEDDCCASVYPDPLLICEPVSINKVGPYDHTNMEVYPYAENLRPDQFYVSEKTVVELTKYDDCDQVYTCDGGSTNIDLEGEDCVDTLIQVDSPYDNGVEECSSFYNEPVHKVVIENCAPEEKAGMIPAWTDLPEKNDLVVDKIAFTYSGPTKDVEVCIYEETEDTAGFQPGEDKQWACEYLDSLDHGLGYDSTYIIELRDRVSKFELGEYDNQRLGGAIIRPQDSRDFYIVVSGYECGEYDADYLYYQDYNSPDWIKWNDGGNVRDTIAGAEPYTRRNDDYISNDPYPVESRTWGYGFGDKVLYNLGFVNGVAKAYFRDLVAETVTVTAGGMQEVVTFLPQPATQVVAINHGDLQNEAVCDGLDEEEETCCGCDEEECRPAMACSDEGYDINLQVTDGFQNKVGLATKVQLESCLLYPKHVMFDNHQVDLWDHMGLGESSNPRDACFNEATFKEAVEDVIVHKLGYHRTYAKMLLEGAEFKELLEDLYKSKDVMFEGTMEDPEYPGHTVVYTDSQGQATIRVVSDDSSLYGIKSYDTAFRILTIPVGLDADYFDVVFSPGEPYQYDVFALPNHGIVADGEQEAKLFIRKLDQCGNPVDVDGEYVKVVVDGSAIISKDFDGNNNYDQDVEGYFQGCRSLCPWIEDCSLEVLNDVIQTVSVTVMDASPECRAGSCTGETYCSGIYNEVECETSDCDWMPGSGDCNQPSSTTIEFVGAPRQLTITEIKHSDLLPADGFMSYFGGPSKPVGACTYGQLQKCHFDNPEICFESCTKYGGSGGWVTVEVQDKYGNLVTGYLGDGLKYDPGDKYGKPDNTFENICVALDNHNAYIDDWTFGFDMDPVFMPSRAKVYCGDLSYGTGSFHVAYKMLDRNGQPLDPRETASVVVSVFDKCDEEMWRLFGFPVFMSWDDECNGQEYDENNLPDSETASRLTPDYGQLDFVAVADRWDVNADKVVVAADGKDYATLTINPENQYMDVRASMQATAQSSLLGSTLESEQIHEECYVEGLKDPLNPTSIIVNTEDCSGGQAKLKLSSTEAGTARITVTGEGYGCKEYINGYEYTDWFEMTFGHGNLNGGSFAMWGENCFGSEFGGSGWSETCSGNLVGGAMWEETCAEHVDDLHIWQENCVVDPTVVTSISCVAAATGTAIAEVVLAIADASALAQCNIAISEGYTETCQGIMVTMADSLETCTGIMVYTESWGESCTGWEMWSAQWGEYCGGFEGVTYHEFYNYHEMAFGSSTTALSELYTPYCIDWGIIPLTPKTIEVEFQQSFQNKIVIEEGWNFFSVPVELANSNDEWKELGLDTICVDGATMFVESSSGGSWQSPSDTTVITPMEGYWCKATAESADTIEVVPKENGVVYLQPAKKIYPGWNDVGLSNYVEMKLEHALISIDKIYTQVLDWIEGLQRFVPYANTGELGGGDVSGTTGTNNMKAGQAYFIWATDEGDLPVLS